MTDVVKPEPKTAECRSCKAPIYWAKVKKKNGDIGNHPLDKAPSPDGTHRATLTIKAKEDGQTEIIVDATWIPPKERAALVERGVRLRTSHFATCPNAEQHRRGDQ
jgi:hypothetical protein